jgi:hypothetical protein
MWRKPARMSNWIKSKGIRERNDVHRERNIYALHAAWIAAH